MEAESTVSLQSIVRKRRGLSRTKLFEKSGIHQLERRSGYDNLIKNSDVNKKRTICMDESFTLKP